MPPTYRQKIVTAPLTEEELDAVTIVFHQFETGLREGTIYTKVWADAAMQIFLNFTKGSLQRKLFAKICFYSSSNASFLSPLFFTFMSLNKKFQNIFSFILVIVQLIKTA